MSDQRPDYGDYADSYDDDAVDEWWQDHVEWALRQDYDSLAPMDQETFVLYQLDMYDASTMVCPGCNTQLVHDTVATWRHGDWWTGKLYGHLPSSRFGPNKIPNDNGDTRLKSNMYVVFCCPHSDDTSRQSYTVTMNCRTGTWQSHTGTCLIGGEEE